MRFDYALRTTHYAITESCIRIRNYGNAIRYTSALANEPATASDAAAASAHAASRTVANGCGARGVGAGIGQKRGILRVAPRVAGMSKRGHGAVRTITSNVCDGEGACEGEGASDASDAVASDGSPATGFVTARILPMSKRWSARVPVAAVSSGGGASVEGGGGWDRDTNGSAVCSIPIRIHP